MKLGLVGFPQVGKRTLFKLLTGREAEGSSVEFGLARVRDGRFDRLVEIYSPEKETAATIELALLPPLDQDAERNAAVYNHLEKVDAICHLVRAFEDDTVFHLAGQVDASRDIRLLAEELLLGDQIFVEKRLERLEKEKGKKDVQRSAQEMDLLRRMQTHLETGRPLRFFEFGDEDLKLITSYPFLTIKPLIVVLNVGEDSLGDNSIAEKLAEEFADFGFEFFPVSARIEEELDQLEAEERAAFLQDLGLEQPALDRLTQVCYRTLGLLSFFTVGTDEVRAWTVRRGAMAPEAGGAIHSDIERGFIRAETMQYADLISLGNEQKVKEAGKLMTKGRDYVVEDGDIFHFLHKA
jgi:ribosome-binding ATPase